MTYVLDTVVLSELRKRRGDPNVLRWLNDRAAERLFVSAITIGEIQRGVESALRTDAAFGRSLGLWLERLIESYEDRILPVDLAVGRRWGRLSVRLGHAGADLLIAATALEHGLIVATRNVRHFTPAGIPVENPFDHA